MRKYLVTVLFVLSVFIVHHPEIINANKTQVEIEIDYINENAKDAHTIYWGSSIGLYMKSNTNKLNEESISWKIKNNNEKEIEVYKEEYTTEEGKPALRIYAPYGYCDDIVIQAIKENAVVATYKLSIVDGTEWNGKTFFNFKADAPNDSQVDKMELESEENWDSEKGCYSITLPDNNYHISGYSFQHWEDNDGKIWKPDEKLTVSAMEGPAFYELHAKWEKSNAKSNPSGENTNNQGTKASNETQSLVVWGICILVGILLIIFCVCIYFKIKGKKHDACGNINRRENESL